MFKIIVCVLSVFFLFPACLFAGGWDRAEEQIVYSGSPVENGAFGYDGAVYGKSAAVISLKDAAATGGRSLCLNIITTPGSGRKR